MNRKAKKRRRALNLRKLSTDVNEASVGFVILKLPCAGRPDNIPAR